MREIAFRGKRVDFTGEWVYGDLSHHKNGKCFIKPTGGDARQSFEVNPETIGEFTGFRDSNLLRIWEGDIVAYSNDDETELAKVVYENGCMKLSWFNEHSSFREDLEYWCTKRKITAVGSVFDNLYTNQKEEMEL